MRNLIILLFLFNTAQAQIIGVVASSRYKATTPTSPAVISDGNTVAWYIADDLTTITKNGSNEVSVWADKLGSGHDLLQSSSAQYPIWSSSGITFDGVNDFLVTNTFTYAAPISIWIVLKQVSWGANKNIIDGFVKDNMLFRQRTTTPDIAVFGGIDYSSTSSSLSIGSVGIVRIVFDATGRFVVNNDTPITGNFGSPNPGGIMLGSSGGIGGFANFEVKEIIFRKVGYNPTNDISIYNYLKTKYGL